MLASIRQAGLALSIGTVSCAGALPPEPQLHALNLCGWQLHVCADGCYRGLQSRRLPPQQGPQG